MATGDRSRIASDAAYKTKPVGHHSYLIAGLVVGRQRLLTAIHVVLWTSVLSESLPSLQSVSRVTAGKEVRAQFEREQYYDLARWRAGRAFY